MKNINNLEMLNEKNAIDNSFKYKSRLETQNIEQKKLEIVYSEKTKEILKSYKQTDSDTKISHKQQADKSIGKASQRRGHGRGCI